MKIITDFYTLSLSTFLPLPIQYLFVFNIDPFKVIFLGPFLRYTEIYQCLRPKEKLLAYASFEKDFSKLQKVSNNYNLSP